MPPDTPPRAAVEIREWQQRFIDHYAGEGMFPMTNDTTPSERVPCTVLQSEMEYVEQLVFETKRERACHEMRIAYGDVCEGIRAAEAAQKRRIVAWLRERASRSAGDLSDVRKNALDAAALDLEESPDDV